MMARKGFNMKLGETGIVQLERIRDRQADQGAGVQPSSTRAMHRRESDLFPPSGVTLPTGIFLFDLGTRLRSVNESVFDGLRLRLASEHNAPVRVDGNHDEYVEIDTNPSNATSLSNDAARDAQNAALLGSRLAGSSDLMDPLAEYLANGTGRKVSACMPIPFNAHTLRLTANTGSGYKRLTEDLSFAGRHPDWVRRTASARDALELWNDLNVADDVPFGAGKIDGVPENLQIRPIQIGGVDFYCSLDTSSSNFKITTVPDYNASGLGNFIPNRLEKVYLRPIPLIWQLRFFTWYDYESSFQPNNGNPAQLMHIQRPQSVLVSFIGRMPIYPKRPLRTTKATSATVASRSYARTLRDMVLRTPGIEAKIDAADAAATAPSLSSSASFVRGGVTWTRVAGSPATVTKMNERNMGRLQLTNASVKAGTLLGIIVAGGVTYYLWKKTDGLISGGTADLLTMDFPANAPTDGVPVSLDDFGIPPTAIYSGAGDGYAPTLNAHNASNGALTTNVTITPDGLKFVSEYQA